MSPTMRVLRLLRLFVITSLCNPSVLAESDHAGKKKKKKILSFGGNGMIGSETLSRLIKTGEYDIVLASRGNWPFDSRDRIKPHVKSVICNRKHGLADCKDLMEDIGQTEEYFAVLDFSAYRPEWVRDAVDALRGKVRVYVYVSTDSVYEVTELEQYKRTKSKIVETDAVRPDNEDRRKELNEDDKYGDRKLQCEEVLLEQRGGAGGGDEGIPYVFMRFADIVGPRDTTQRFDTYYMWIKNIGLNNVPSPIHVPKGIVESTSITYSVDAAESIIAAISKPETWDEPYNVACEEIFNVTSSIMTLGHLMGNHYIKPKRVKSKNSYTIYPSVTRGPVDITKARERLGFEPTQMDIAFQKTLTWYNRRYKKDKAFRKACIDQLISLVDDHNDYVHKDERGDVIDSLLSEMGEDSLSEMGEEL